MNKLSTWLNEHTFHCSEFKNIKELVDLKKAKGLTISVCFPTLNEEKTIGKSLVVIKSELMDRYPLIDQLAVIDSGSTDRTREIAKEFGAEVYLASDYLKEEGAARGKGENLWKAIYLLKGDIIAYIDSDISNIHHRFAYGLIGPLLKNNKAKFVKAFYKRPIKQGNNLSESGGGRVTEILIRPLFSQFFPELSGIIQPLSGEYAGYREIFEKIKFPIGYGVETGMLIDIYQNWGLEVIAQVDLEQRIHRNQHISGLRKMSFGVMQTFWQRLQTYKSVNGMEPETLTLKHIEKKEKSYIAQEIEIIETERKPMIEVQAYKEKYKK